MQDYGGIFLPPTCKINYDNMQENYVNMQENYANMQENYVKHARKLCQHASYKSFRKFFHLHQV
jgi:hypothetical protein